jgi:hypothetical protein
MSDAPEAQDGAELPAELVEDDVPADEAWATTDDVDDPGSEDAEQPEDDLG